MSADQLLEAMIDADPVLYERILDTPGFALYFNRLCLLAAQHADLLAACKQAFRRVRKLNEGGPEDIGEDPTITKLRDAIRKAEPGWTEEG